MPAIVFASNNIAHFPNSLSGSVLGTFDSDRVPYAIALSNYEEIHSPTFPEVTGDDTWFHMRVHATDNNYARTDTLLKAYDAAGNLLFDVKKKQNSYDYLPQINLYDGGSTSLSQACTLPLTRSKTNSVDLRFTQTNLLLRIEVYVNGSLSGSSSFFSNPNAFGHPIRFTLGTAFTDTLSDEMYVSEIIVADGDTRNARLDLLRPTSAGQYDDWLGQLAVLADDDTTTGMTTVNAGDRHSMTMSAYTGASNISNFITVSTTTRGQNSPAGLQHSVRLSGVDYDSVVHPIDFALAYQITDYKINPATSLPWEGSDLAAIEVGFVSVT